MASFDKVHCVGWAEKQGGKVKTWKTRYLKLTSEALHYFVSERHPRPKGSIELGMVSKVESVQKPNAHIGLEIYTPSRVYLLRFADNTSRQVWETALQSALANLPRLRERVNTIKAIKVPQQQSAVQAPSLMSGAPATQVPQMQVAAPPTDQPPMAQQSAAAPVPSPMQNGTYAYKAPDVPALYSSPTLTTLQSIEKQMLLAQSDQPYLTLPPHVVGVADQVNAVLTHLSRPPSDPAAPRIVMVTGAVGSGRNTVLHQARETIKGFNAVPFLTNIPQLRQVGMMICTKCNHARLAPPGDAPSDLLTVKTSASETRTASGAAVKHKTIKCTECKEGVYDVLCGLIPEGEQTAIQQLHVQAGGTLEACFIQCSACKATGMPMTQEGICKYDPSTDTLWSATGVQQAPPSSMSWKAGLPHISQKCQTSTIGVHAVNWSMECSTQLASLFTTTVYYCPTGQKFGMLHETFDYNLVPHTALPGGLITNAMAKAVAHNSSLPSLDGTLDKQSALNTLNDRLQRLEAKTTASMFFIHGLDETVVTCDELLDLHKGGPACSRVKMAVTVREETCEAFAAKLDQHQVPYAIVRVPDRHAHSDVELIVREAAENTIHTLSRGEFLQRLLEESGPGAGGRQIDPKAFDDDAFDESHYLTDRATLDGISAAIMGAYDQAGSGPEERNNRPLLYWRFATSVCVWLAAYKAGDGVAFAKALPPTLPGLLSTFLDKAVERLGNACVLLLQCMAATNILPTSVESCSQVMADIGDYEAITLAEVMRVVTALRSVIFTTREYRQGNICMAHVSFLKHLESWVPQTVSPPLQREFRTAFSALLDSLASSINMELIYDKAHLTRQDPAETAGIVCSWNMMHILCEAQCIDIMDELERRCHKFFQSDAKMLEDLLARIKFTRQNFEAFKSQQLWSSTAAQFVARRHAGVVQTVMKGQRDASITVPSQLVRIFTSSTFDDLKVERDELWQRAFPLIRQQLKQLNLEFQVVDMRWGIRDESTADHKTTDICMEEIRACQTESLGPNFVTLLSQRYGYRPFPNKIVQEEFETLLAQCSAEDQKVLSMWFKLDTNTIPAQYWLLPVTEHLQHFLEQKNMDKRRADRGKWWEYFEQMSAALRTAALQAFAGDTPEAKATRHRYIQSITEDEIVNGLLDIPLETRTKQCLWLRRNIVDLDQYKTTDDSRISAFTDMQDGKVDEEAEKLLYELREERVAKALPPSCVLEYDVKYAPNKGIDPSDPEHRSYLDTMTQDFVEKMLATVRMNYTAQASAVTVHDTIREIAKHLNHRDQYTQAFAGRATQLAQLTDYVKSPATHPMFVCGPEGSGKTALAAAVSAQLVESMPDACIITRFVGLTPSSTVIHRLLLSLFQQVCGAYDLEKEIPTDFQQLNKDLISVLKAATAEKPIVILLDGIDRLSASQRGREIDSWLACEFPPHVKCIVTLDNADEQIWRTAMRTTHHLDNFAETVVELPSLSSDETVAIVDKVLESQQRQLTPNQRGAVLSHVKDASPLHLSMLMHISKSWKSDTKELGLGKKKTVVDAFYAILDRLERTHGVTLTKHVLCYITLSREGLSATELEDILSLDDKVLADVFQYWEPPTRRIPPLVLVRLLRDLGSYLSTTGSSAGTQCYVWTHSSFGDMVLARYCKAKATSAPKPRTLATDASKIIIAMDDKDEKIVAETNKAILPFHIQLVEYFSGQWHNTSKPYKAKDGTEKTADRLVPPMPNLIKPGTTFPSPHFRYPNSRKLTELPFHLTKANRKESLLKLLSNPEVLDFFVVVSSTETSVQTERPDLSFEMSSYCHVVGGAQRIVDGTKAVMDDMHFRFTKLGHSFLGRNLVASANAIIQISKVYAGATPQWVDEIWREGMEKVASGSSSGKVYNLFQDAERAIAEGQTTRAAQLIQEALGESARKTGKVSQEAVVHRVQATQLFVKIGAQEPAMHMATEAVQIANALGPSGAKQLVQAMGALALAYKAGGDLKNACALAERAYAAAVMAYGESSTDTATFEHNFAALLIETGEVERAEPLMRNVIAYRKKHLGERHIEVGVSLCNLSSVYLLQYQKTQDKACLDKCLEVLNETKVIYDEHPATDAEHKLQLAASYLEYYLDQQEMDTALTYCKTTIAEVEASPSAVKHQVLAICKHNFGVMFMNHEQLPYALEMLQDALKTRELTFGPTSPMTGQTVECIAICLQKMGRMQESLPYVQRVQSMSAMGSFFPS
eukprot:m.306518 g.306518  ORF g.306518 m.306518 type:complete len:2218 (-) comp15923_c1_seq2:58-6711(-)